MNVESLYESGIEGTLHRSLNIGTACARLTVNLLLILVLSHTNALAAVDGTTEFDPVIAAKKAFTPVEFRAGNPNDPVFDFTPLDWREMLKKPGASMDAILEYADSPYMPVRDMVISNLGHLDREDNGRIDDKRVVAAIVASVTDEETQLVVRSLEFIGHFDKSFVTGDLIKKIGEYIAQSQIWGVAENACFAAGDLGDASFLPYLQKAMKKPLGGKPLTEEWHRNAAAKVERAARKAAARLGDPAASAEIRKEISSGDLVKQYNAIMDAAYARDKKAVELIVPFLDKEYGPPNPDRDSVQYGAFEILACNALDMIVDGKDLRRIDESTTREKARKRAAVWKEWWGKNKDKWLLPPVGPKADQ
ncbi:MAG TPA: hypothetical protein PKJ23_16560 [bacterium]|nr:hypothetical protein [bacterium]